MQSVLWNIQSDVSKRLRALKIKGVDVLVIKHTDSPFLHVTVSKPKSFFICAEIRDDRSIAPGVDAIGYITVDGMEYGNVDLLSKDNLVIDDWTDPVSTIVGIIKWIALQVETKSIEIEIKKTLSRIGMPTAVKVYKSINIWNMDLYYDKWRTVYKACFSINNKVAWVDMYMNGSRIQGHIADWTAMKKNGHFKGKHRAADLINEAVDRVVWIVENVRDAK